ncbi:hypothetical protein SGPA1_50014 [Streptomyces misionensis JCM 4497]
MPLNAWDAANYAGFTNAARLCPRGGRLCRGVAHVQGATRAERKTRHRSRPRGNQQRRTRATRQRSWRPTRADSSLRQDLRGALGVEGHGAAGRRAAPHRGRHRTEARPPGAAARDRPGGRGPRTRSGSRLPPGRGAGGEVGHRAVPARPRRAPGRRRRHLAVARRLLRGERLRDARLTLADNPRRQLGRAGGRLRRGHRRGGQSRPQRRAQAARGRRGRQALGLQVRRRRLAFVDGAGVPARGGGATAARRLLRRGGPRPVRRLRRIDPAGRVDGLRHRSAGGRPALLHPGAAARPRGGRRPARRVRPRLHVAPGHLPGLRRRGGRPGAGRAGAQPGTGHGPHHELLPAGRGARPRARRGRAGGGGGPEGGRGLAGAGPGGGQRPLVARLLRLRPVRRGRRRVLPGPEAAPAGAALHRAGPVQADGGVRALARAAAGRLRGRRAGVREPGRGVRAGGAGGGGGRTDLVGPHHRVREGPAAPPGAVRRRTEGGGTAGAGPAPPDGPGLTPRPCAGPAPPGCGPAPAPRPERY